METHPDPGSGPGDAAGREHPWVAQGRAVTEGAREEQLRGAARQLAPFGVERIEKRTHDVILHVSLKDDEGADGQTDYATLPVLPVQVSIAQGGVRVGVQQEDGTFLGDVFVEFYGGRYRVHLYTCEDEEPVASHDLIQAPQLAPLLRTGAPAAG